MKSLPRPSLGAVAAACALALLAVGCGQRGPLYLPTEPAAANRATLPQTLTPGATPTNPAPPAGATPPDPGRTGTGTASPVRN